MVADPVPSDTLMVAFAHEPVAMSALVSIITDALHQQVESDRVL